MNLKRTVLGGAAAALLAGTSIVGVGAQSASALPLTCDQLEQNYIRAQNLGDYYWQLGNFAWASGDAATGAYYDSQAHFWWVVMRNVQLC